MTSTTTSLPSISANFFDVLMLIDRSENLSVRRRQDLASAVRTVARVFGRDPAQIPCRSDVLARRLAEVPYLAHGLSKGRWANIRSLVNAALDLVQPMMPGRHQEPLSPAWEKLMLQSDDNNSLRRRVSKAVHWLSARKVEPDQVTQEHLNEFLEALRQTSLAKDPEAAWRNYAYGWNRAITRISGWPPVAITVQNRRPVQSLPWSAFPSSFKEDVDGYLAHVMGCDLLGEGPVRPVKQITADTWNFHLRYFASALVHRGHDPSTIRTLADLTAIDRFKEGLRFFIEKNDGKSSSYIHAFAALMKAIAQHWVKVDDEHLKEMIDIASRLAPARRGMTRKNRDRVRQFEDRNVAVALVTLPDKLMRIADAVGAASRKAAILAQKAVAIELLLMAPMRISNLAAIDLDVHLVRHRRSGAVHLVIDPEIDEVKNDEPLDFPLPAETVVLIDRYVDTYRPLLVRDPTNRALFPNSTNGSKGRSLLGKQISETVFKYIGVKMNPHLFRHVAAKLFLDQTPGGYGVVQRVLAHRSADTTTRFYTGFETAAAVRHFDDVVLSLRHGDRP